MAACHTAQFPLTGFCNMTFYTHGGIMGDLAAVLIMCLYILMSAMHIDASVITWLMGGNTFMRAS